MLKWFLIIVIVDVKLVDGGKNEKKNKTISSVDLYPLLDFKLPQRQIPWLWDKELELEYLNGLQHWKDKPLRVFIIPFSHNDAGWIYTFEEYFDRSSRSILDHITKVLPTLERFYFVWSEICFLDRWWARAETSARRKLLQVLESGQLEIVTGAWVMPDEATTTVFALLDQLIEGNQWVNSKLGVKVETAWSIDPFGVSSTWPYLLAESGVKFTLAQRVHWAWKRHLSKTKTLEMIWKRDENDNSDGIRLRVQPTASYSLTSSCGPNTYICAQYDFNPEISEARPIKFFNIRQRVERLMGQYGRLGSLSDDNIALITLGTDFRYENSSEWVSQYYNYRAIIDYVNSNVDLYHSHLQFATLKGFMDQTCEPGTTFMGDFFVYSDLGPDVPAPRADYWSGYYSTRPYWKLLGRKLESTLRSAEILYSMCHARTIASQEIARQQLESSYYKLVYSRRMLGLFQHHDAITGTSRKCVMEDFEKKLKRAIRCSREVEGNTASLLTSRMKEWKGLVRATRSKVISSFPSIITIFNSLMAPRSEVISLRVSRTDLMIFDNMTGNTVPHQVNFCNLMDDFELVFIPMLAPLSMTDFIICSDPAESKSLSKVFKLIAQETDFNFTIKTQSQSLIFNSGTGMMSGLFNESGGQTPLEVSVKAYESEPRRSGAYLFHPTKEHLTLNTSLCSKNIYVLEGPLYKDVVTNFGDTFSVRTRAFEHGYILPNLVEITTVTDLGPTTDNINLEIYLKISTDMESTKFFTDVNGFNYRQRHTLKELGVGGNYYPMTEEIYIENDESRLTLLSDHSHGAASLQDGEMEVMLDRRILLHDQRGLYEGLLDEKRAKSRFLVFKSDIKTAIENSHILSLQLNHEAPIFFPQEGFSQECRPLVSQQLPPNIHLLNFKTLSTADGLPTNAIIMLLQRRYATEAWQSNQAFLNDTIFYDTNPQIIARSLLNGISEFETYLSLNEVLIEPFSLVALKLYF